MDRFNYPYIIHSLIYSRIYEGELMLPIGEKSNTPSIKQCVLQLWVNLVSKFRILELEGIKNLDGPAPSFRNDTIFAELIFVIFVF